MFIPRKWENKNEFVLSPENRVPAKFKNHLQPSVRICMRQISLTQKLLKTLDDQEMVKVKDYLDRQWKNLERFHRSLINIQTYLDREKEKVNPVKKKKKV